ncbi:MAG TPA: glycosyltransferase family 4 protein [Candidatus Binataceae bacterium]|nr:glycosyltransferase family 4 protein [Candidatus Binataceae bacterium]
MHIGLIARRFDPAGGGTERDLIVTAQCLAEAGHEVSVYTSQARGVSRRWRVVEVGSRWPIGSLQLMRFAWEAPAQARRDGAELVLSFARAVGADVLRSGGGAHSAYLQSARRWRGDWAAAAMRLRPYHRAQMIVERAAFKSPTLRRAIAVSQLVRTQLIDELGLEPDKAVTLYNGVDLERFHPSSPAERGRLRQTFEVETGAPVVAFAGNGFARKGLGPLLEAWPAIESHPYLLIAGADRAALRYVRLAHRLGIGSRVRFLGAVGQIEQLFQAADAFALPSFFEPFGNVVMEAMAGGLGVLASVQSGVAELLPAAMHPFVVRDPGSSAEIAERLAALLETKHQFAEIVRAAAEAHPWSAYSAGLLEIIDSLGS